MKKLQNKILLKFFTLRLHTLCTALLLLFGFTLSLNPTPGNWYQQFMPNLGGRTIQDIIFIDSLTGFAVTNSNGQYDTAFILKTSNSGDVWTKIYARTAWFTGFNRIKFINNNTGFVSGVSVSGGPKGLTKTTDGGISWFDINIPDPYLSYLDMSNIDENTIWLVSSESLTGGVFFTSNGGANWVQQFSGGNQNPNKIYMYNARIGFMSNSSALPNIYRTINGGQNWNISTPGESFLDIHFVDSLLGWRSWVSIYGTYDTSMKKTTDGGLTWIRQYLPNGQGIIQYGIYKFTCINKDTIIGIGSSIFYPNNQVRGILYKTLDAGVNWGYQIPDTSLHFPGGYDFINFINNKFGWAYNSGLNPVSGIHTTNGGDTMIYYTGIKKFNNKVPKDFLLNQNYPNPYNPKTVIGYNLKVAGFVNLKVYDISGKFIANLVNQKQSYGEYKIDFDGSGYSSGVYFYSLLVNDDLIETKKMLLIK